nr:hypothetical protein [Tanacetum cinerariifolium]
HERRKRNRLLLKRMLNEQVTRVRLLLRRKRLESMLGLMVNSEGTISVAPINYFIVQRRNLFSRTTRQRTLMFSMLEELNHLRSDCLKERQLNDGLSKKLVLLESAHAQSFNKERELFDRLKDMEKDKDEWRHTIAAHVERIKY